MPERCAKQYGDTNRTLTVYLSTTGTATHFSQNASQSLPDGLVRCPAPLGHEMSGERTRTFEKILLEHTFRGHRINRCMTHDLPTLTATMLANHLTIKFPRSNALSEFAQLPQDASDSERRRLEHVVAGENLIIRCHRSALRLGLLEVGHRQFLDHVDTNPDGDWVIHMFFADASASAIPLVAGITNGTVTAESATPNFKALIDHRLKRLERRNRLTGGHCWWDWDDDC
jgi:hypothetical protein